MALLTAFGLALSSAVALPDGVVSLDSLIEAKAETYGDYSYSLLSDNTIMINKYNGDDINIVVPETINGKTVSCIGQLFIPINAETVTLPDTITKIENSAFSGCDKLKEINLPDSLTYLGIDAFSDCSSLTSISLPDSITSLNGTFMRCYSLKSIKLPKRLKTIGDHAIIIVRELNHLS